MSWPSAMNVSAPVGVVVCRAGPDEAVLTGVALTVLAGPVLAGPVLAGPVLARPALARPALARTVLAGAVVAVVVDDPEVAPHATASIAMQASAATAVPGRASGRDEIIAGVLFAQGRLREPCDRYDGRGATVVAKSAGWPAGSADPPRACPVPATAGASGP